MNSNMNRSMTLRIICFGLLPIGIFFSGYAASAATAPQSQINVCVNKKTGDMRQVAKCSNLENSVALQAAGSGTINLIAKHVFPVERSQSQITATPPVCPASAPIFLGNRAFIAEGSQYWLSDLGMAGSRSVQNINGSGFTPGEIWYTSKNNSATVKVNTPLPEKLELYLITSCMGANQITTVKY